MNSCDTFNEMDPPSGDLDALEASSKAVYGSMAAIDSDAVWLMQAWLFIHDFWTKHPERVKAYVPFSVFVSSFFPSCKNGVH